MFPLLSQAFLSKTKAFTGSVNVGYVKKSTIFSLSEPTKCFVDLKKTNCSELNGFSFFSVGFALLTSWVSSLLWEFCIHWFAIMAVLLLSSKNLIFFWFTQMSFVRSPWCFTQKNWVFLVHSNYVLRSREKLNFSVFSTKVHGQNSFSFTRKKQGFLIREAKLA